MAPFYHNSHLLAESLIISGVTAEGNLDLKKYQLSIAVKNPKTQWLEKITIHSTHKFVGQWFNMNGYSGLC